MKKRNYANTAAYFERRAAKAATSVRRRHFESFANLYREKASCTGQAGGDAHSEMSRNCEGGGPLRPSRRQRLAAMFRACGDAGNIARRADGQTRINQNVP